MWGYRGGLSCYLLLTQSVGWELGREGLFWFISSLLSCLAACSSLSFLFHLFGEQLPVHVPSKQFKRRWVEVIGPGIEGWLFGGHKCAFVFWVSRKLMSCLAGEKGEVGRHKGEEHMHIYSQHHPPKIAVASHSLTVVTKQSCTFPKQEHRNSDTRFGVILLFPLLTNSPQVPALDWVLQAHNLNRWWVLLAVRHTGCQCKKILCIDHYS